MEAFTAEDIRGFILSQGGHCTKNDLVNHFKHYLVDPDTKVEMRKLFKKLVNKVAVCDHQDGDTIIILRPMTPVTPSRVLSNETEFQTPISPLAGYNEDFNYSKATPPISPPSMNNNFFTSERPIERTPKRTSVGSNMGESESENSSRRCSDTTSQAFLAEIQNKPQMFPIAHNSKQDIEHVDSQSIKSDQSGLPRGSSSNVSISSNDGENISNKSYSSSSVQEYAKKFQKMSFGSASTYRRREPKKYGKEGDIQAPVSMTSEQHAFMMACAQGHFKIFFETENPQLLDYQDTCLGTPLHWAAKHGKHDFMETIHSFLPSVSYACKKNNAGNTALHICAAMGDKDGYQKLIDLWGPEINIRNYQGILASNLQHHLENTDHPATPIRKAMSKEQRFFKRIGSLNIRMKAVGHLLRRNNPAYRSKSN